MIDAGQYHDLVVSRISSFGLFLANDNGEEVLLPNRHVSMADKPGDVLRVFVYHDSEDRPVATKENPLVTAGGIAYLRVVDKNDHGAFLDWGLEAKHLFLPNRNQQQGVVVGRRYLVYVYRDSITGRAVGSMKLRGWVNNDVIGVSVGDEVSIIVASESEIGWRVIVEPVAGAVGASGVAATCVGEGVVTSVGEGAVCADTVDGAVADNNEGATDGAGDNGPSRHWGMLYRNQVFVPVAIGDRLSGFVRRVTDDGRIDVALGRRGYDEVKDAAGTEFSLKF